MSNIDWSKAPEGFPIWIEGLNGMFGTGWHRDDGDRWVGQQGSYWPKGADERGNCRIHLAEWSGEGLPPVGTVCKVSAHHIHKSAWTEVQVLSHAKHEKDDALLVCEIECDGSKSAMHGVIYRSPAFRPIRTPSQIAADEREAFARNLVTEMGKDPEAFPGSVNQALKIYDLGYRKGDAK